MGTSDIDQVSKIGKLGLIDGNLVIIVTKFSFLWPSFSTIFWKYMIQTSYQKFVQSKLVFHYNSFLCKRRCLYLQKSSCSEIFCDQKKLGRYDDQVSAMMTKFFLKCMKNTWSKHPIKNSYNQNLYFILIPFCAKGGVSISKNIVTAKCFVTKKNLVAIMTKFPFFGKMVMIMTKLFLIWLLFFEIEVPSLAQ